MSIETRIAEIEEELARTEYNKKTQHHIGKLKARLAQLKKELERRKGAGRAAVGVKKSGHATVAIIGFPSVGKSTLLNKLTDAKSETGCYDFTTTSVIPGVLDYKGAKIQILDMPGIVQGAADGRGRGREVLGIARNADLILLMGDVFHYQFDVLARELYDANIRLNQRPPQVLMMKKAHGGINVQSTVRLTKLDTAMIRGILNEWGYINADVILRENIDEDQFIDHIAGNRVYIPAFGLLNKTDLVTETDVKKIIELQCSWNVLPVSALHGTGIEELKERIFKALDLIRIFLRPQGKEPDFNEPMIIRRGGLLGDVCDIIHRDFRRKFRYAQVWGKSVKFGGMRVGLKHRVEDGDVVTIVLHRG